MATPEAAKHRDLEQKFRDLDRRIRDLTTSALTRPKLVVDAGDFTVSGGGNVVVRDGGGLQALHDDGSPSLTFGPYVVGGNPTQGSWAAPGQRRAPGRVSLTRTPGGPATPTPRPC